MQISTTFYVLNYGTHMCTIFYKHFATKYHVVQTSVTKIVWYRCVPKTENGSSKLAKAIEVRMDSYVHVQPKQRHKPLGKTPYYIVHWSGDPLGGHSQVI